MNSVGLVLVGAAVSLAVQWLTNVQATKRERERLASEERREAQRLNEARLGHLRGVLDDAAIALTAAVQAFNAAYQMNIALRSTEAAILHAQRLRIDRGSDPLAAYEAFKSTFIDLRRLEARLAVQVGSGSPLVDAFGTARGALGGGLASFGRWPRAVAGDDDVGFDANDVETLNLAGHNCTSLSSSLRMPQVFWSVRAWTQTGQ